MFTKVISAGALVHAVEGARKWCVFAFDYGVRQDDDWCNNYCENDAGLLHPACDDNTHDAHQVCRKCADICTEDNEADFDTTNQVCLCMHGFGREDGTAATACVPNAAQLSLSDAVQNLKNAYKALLSRQKNLVFKYRTLLLALCNNCQDTDSSGNTIYLGEQTSAALSAYRNSIPMNAQLDAAEDSAKDLFGFVALI